MSNATKCDRCGAVYKGIETLIILPGQDDGRDLCADCARAFDAWMEYQPVTDATERVTESGEMLHDTREQLEADVRNVMSQWRFETGWSGNTAHGLEERVVMQWLDRQAAITEREHQREIATLKEHRAGNMDKLRELTDECAELRKRKGLAEKYRADSIAAQAECERYRAKLGAVLDAINDAMRAAR